MNDDPYARQAAGQPSAGIATGDEQRYADGFLQGDVMWRFGTKISVVRDRPGWFVADGTQPDLVVAGTNYGKPNLSKRMLIGADGSVGFAVGDIGGSDGVPAHLHSFTHEFEHFITQPIFAGALTHVITQPVFAGPPTHVITQPVFDGPIGHTITQPVFDAPTAHTSPLTHTQNHAGSAVAAHGNHVITVTEFVATGLAPSLATGIYAITGAIGGGTTPVTLVHTANHTVTQPTAHGDHTIDHNHDALTRSTGVGLSNNAPHAAPFQSVLTALSANSPSHTAGAQTVLTALSNNAPAHVPGAQTQDVFLTANVGGHVGGAVGPVTSPSSGNYPPYVAVWPLIKVYA